MEVWKKYDLLEDVQWSSKGVLDAGEYQQVRPHLFMHLWHPQDKKQWYFLVLGSFPHTMIGASWTSQSGQGACSTFSMDILTVENGLNCKLHVIKCWENIPWEALARGACLCGPLAGCRSKQKHFNWNWLKQKICPIVHRLLVPIFSHLV